MTDGSQRFQESARREVVGDAALVGRALAGDREAFGALVERYAPQARRVARAVLHDPDDADDAAQDAFLAALAKLDSFDASRPFGPWLLRIVANAATDRARRRRVRATEPVEVDRIAGRERPDRDADRSLLSQQLRAALAELLPRRRLAVVLYDAEGYAHAEIAKILGIPEGTVRSEVFQARRHLRTLLDHWKGHEP